MVTRFDDWEGEYLAHFGVLGMRWGIRKDRRATYEKAAAKLSKLDQNRAKKELKRTRAELTMQKALAKQGKVENKRVGPDDPNYDSYKKKSAKAYSAADKATKKYENAKFQATKASYKEQKWTQSMLKAFGATTMKELETRFENRTADGKAIVEEAFSKKGHKG